MRCVTFAVTVLILIQGQASASLIVDTNWWSNRTASQNVIDPLFGSPPITERVRLAGFQSGFAEGTVSLPQSGLWEVFIPVVADESPLRDPNDFVDVFVNGAFVGRAFNTPPATATEFRPQITGASFTYRFEFTSSNTTVGLHQLVERGTATPVPEPSTLVLFSVALIFVFGLVLYRRTKSNRINSVLRS